MDLLLLIIVFVSSILCLAFFGLLEPIRNGLNRFNNRLGERVPEAAGSWLIIGHLHLIAGSQVPHILLGSMADYISEMAKECFTTNDRVFASRQKAMVSELMGYNYSNFVLAPYGPYWRHIRRIIVLEIGSLHHLQMLEHIRVSEVNSSLIDICKTWVTNKGSSETVMVDMKQWFGNLVTNIVVRMMFGKHFSPGEQNQDQFQKATKQFGEVMGGFVPSDAIPWLRWLDLGGYEKKMKKTATEIDLVFNGWLEDRKKKMNSTSTQQEDDSRDQT
ncbi:putative cytochrome P450 [Helianthus annuus]|nr:putative cytochrome P450 [Helianthus annuus]